MSALDRWLRECPVSSVVPAEDVKPLLEGLRHIARANNAVIPDLSVDGAMRTTKGYSADLIREFCSKHPQFIK